MKQVLIIFFSVLFLFSSGGMVIAKHFCGGELMEASFFKELHSCHDEGGNMPNGCCDIVHQSIRHDENTQITFQSIDPPEQIILYTIEYTHLVQTSIKSIFVDNSYLLRSLTVPDWLARYQSFLL